jgi:hypothetical protein
MPCFWEMLFEYSHENAGLEALHFHGEPKQFKIGLPIAFSELRLDEAEPDSWFLFIAGAKLDLSGSYCLDGLTIVSFRHVLRKIERGDSQCNCRELFPEE